MSKVSEYEEKIFRAINPAVNFSVSRYVLAVGFFVAVVVFGFISMLGLGVDLFPAVNIPVVVVTTGYPGATPTVVDQQITQTMENVVSTLSGITDLNSESQTGLSRVVLQFDPSSDQNSDANQVAALVAAAVKRLPTGITPPVVQTFNPNSAPILQFGIYGTGASLESVADYVTNNLTPLLERVNGVANITVDGAPTREFQVLLNPNRLQYYNVTPTQVVSAIESAAINQPIGTIQTRTNSLTFSTQNVPSDITQISQTLVDAVKGVSVGDVSTVRDSATASDYARVNGLPVVLVSIQQTSNSNSVAVAQGVRDLLARTQLPNGYSIIYSNDTTGPIKASVQSTYRELFLTALVVAFIVLLFLGRLNAALSVILAIPIALSAAPILYRMLGFTFNLVSLLALLVAIGIVVDDSIVVAENVDRYRQMGFNRKDAVLKGASEVFSAVIAASLSILSVLLPVSAIGGFVGRYLTQFSLGLAAAVFFSLLEAILFLTVRLAYTPDSKGYGWRDFGASFAMIGPSFKWGFRAWRKPFGIVAGLVVAAGLVVTKHFVFLPTLIAYPVALSLLFYVGRIVFTFFESLSVTLHNWTEAGLDWLREAYVRSLGGVMNRGRWVLIGSAVFFVATAILIAPRIPFNFVPQSDNGTLSVNLRLPPGTPIDLTNSDMGRIESWLLKRPEIETIQSVVGGGGVFAGASAPQNGSVTVTLVDVRKRQNVFDLIPEYRGALLALLRDQPSARLFVSAGGGFGGGSALNLDLVSSNLDLLNAQNTKILAALQENKYVGDVTSSLSQTTFENDFLPDQSKLKGTGINPSTIANSLMTYAAGVQAGTVEQGGLSYPIQVQVNPTFLSNGQSLLNFPIYSPTLQTNLRAGQLGVFKLQEAPVQLNRYNRLYTAELSINLKPNAPAPLTFQQEITKELTAQGLLGNGVDLNAGSRFGPAALAAQLAVTGPLTFLLAFFLAYLVMAAQFNSWRYPIYLLLPVPLALVGALWLVFVLNSGLDVFGILGMLLLIGLSAKNAIIYLDFVVKRIGKMPFREALIESARLRFRPIVMTTLTVLVISFPLILGRGQGSEFGQKLGIVMLGGILFSAILTFFVVPSAFYLFERKRPSVQVAADGNGSTGEVVAEPVADRRGDAK